ncbi:UPF0577 protein KIAA1324-like [Anneissia japonica]|uniref:UPF0577 protein KIAA1324-like n=1 Tax=Anneissia japonica TaxID=1529436 RepID=UPI001425B271|nr:UPF0577 protein KIAA1324-like [Anneissia japonica]
MASQSQRRSHRIAGFRGCIPAVVIFVFTLQCIHQCSSSPSSKKKVSSPASTTTGDAGGSPAKQTLPTCQLDDFHFEYTACRTDGVRWRVSVPDPETCENGGPPPPVRAVDCGIDDFHFEYTACRTDGVRWRVSVPDPETCENGGPPPPVRAVDCGFTCEAGKYLDIQNTQTCKDCPAGQYSLGGGQRFEGWSKIPHGFESVSEKIDSDWATSTSNCSE